MAIYGYVAINRIGKEVKGSIEADDAQEAMLKLRGQTLTVVSLTEQNILTRDLDIQIGGYPKARDLSVMCRQFVSMTKAGVTMIETLQMLYEQTENKRLKDALKEVRMDIEKGEALASALAEHPKVFPKLMVSMVAAGEASGNLDIALERVAKQLDRTGKTQGLVKKAMIYPIMVFLVAIVITVVMLVVVIPSYESMFADLGTDLPGITVMYVNLSKALRQYWFIIIPAVAAIVTALVMFGKTATGKHLYGKIVLKIPVIKDLVIKSASSQIARTMSTLMGSGVLLVDAAGMTADTMSNVWFEDAMRDAQKQISMGVPLSRPIEESGLFPPMVYHMIRIGEESGNTEEMLEKLADYYDEEVEMAVQSLIAAMEPMIIIVLAAIVGSLVAACMAPMLSMYDALDKL